jgi:hypothetical protein
MNFLVIIIFSICFILIIKNIISKIFSKKSETLYWYEVHILVQPELEDQIDEWVQKNKDYFTKKYKLANFRKMATVTSTGSYPRQPMLTFKVQKTNFDDSVSLCNKISKIIEQNLKTTSNAITRQKVEGTANAITRQKVEGVANAITRQKVEGVANAITRQKVEGVANEKPYDPSMPLFISGTQYYEFHTKVNIVSNSEWERLAKLLSEYSIPLLYNPNSNMIRPVTTERYYDTNWETATKKHMKIKEILVDNNFEILNDSWEYSMYDTNLYTDKGWMFENDPKIFFKKSEYAPEAFQPPSSFLDNMC